MDTQSSKILSRDPAIDLMRVISILVILLHHLPAYGLNVWKILDDALPLHLSFLGHQSRYLGLGSFVFISGYLLHGRNYRMKSLSDVTAFLKKRFVRIYPLYYLALIIYISMFYIYLGREFTIANGFTHLFGMQLLYGRPVPTIWFISLVTLYYIFFALIRYMSQRRDLLLPLSAIIFALLVLIKAFFPPIDSRLVIYWPTFVFGIWFSSAHSRIDLLRCGVALTTTAMASWVYLHYLCIPDSQPISLEFLVTTFVLSALMGGCNIVLLYIVRWVNWGKAGRWARLGAYASYTVFLFHRPVYMITKELVEASHASQLVVPALFIASLFLFIGSYFLQVFVDRFLITIHHKPGSFVPTSLED